MNPRTRFLQEENKSDKGELYEKLFVLFSTEQLIALGKFFDDYVGKYGSAPLIQTSSPFFNSWSNYALSFTHIIPTNQEFAQKCKNVIDTALTESQKKPELTAVYVVDAIEALKNIQKEMRDKNIRGTVRTQIETIVTTYKLPLDDNLFKKAIDDIVHVLKNARTYTPLIRPLLEEANARSSVLSYLPTQ
jgi:hypothetical protein